eukprot:TRINITY_DN44180_c0_g1_i1.p1 TRINITY_DN44180_c0_g1~~TRINITY_DN44180_c0_g1_i1.p1  ORF type:complete len:442 (+),score=107.06 TRINITY_DN44180_c0_g1_i1:55-1380(+)
MAFAQNSPKATSDKQSTKQVHVVKTAGPQSEQATSVLHNGDAASTKSVVSQTNRTMKSSSALMDSSKKEQPVERVPTEDIFAFKAPASGVEAKLRKIRTLREQLDEERDEFDKLERSLNDAEKEKRELQIQIADVRREARDLQKTLDGLREENFSMSTKLAGANTVKAGLHASVESKGQNNAILNAAFVALSKQVLALRTKLEHARKDDVKTNQQTSEFEAQLKKAREEFEVATQQKKNLTRRHVEVLKNQAELRNATTQLRCQSRSLQDLLGTTEKERVHLQSQVSVGDLRSLEKKLDRLNRIKEALLTRLNEMEQKGLRLCNDVTSAEKAKEGLDHEIVLLHENKIKMQQELHLLVSQKASDRKHLLHEQHVHLTDAALRVTGQSPKGANKNVKDNRLQKVSPVGTWTDELLFNEDEYAGPVSLLSPLRMSPVRAQEIS